MSAVVRSKVKSKLNSKSLNFKSDFPGGKQLKIIMVTKDLSSRCKLRKFSNFFFENDFKAKNMKKTESPKITSKVHYELLIRSYERFKYFSQT